MLREKLKKIKLPNPAGMEHFVQEIVEKLAPTSIILHGSAAKGTFVDKLSDIDIIVISPKFSDINPKDRFTRLLELAQRHRLRVEALGYTPQEFLRMIKRLNFFALDVVYYGLRLHDENGFWDKACEAFKEVEKKYALKKTETGGWTYRL